ncbi:MAG: NAD(P)H-hydrate epimerase [Candidatus Micrarchaeota archaeon]|nr:NAD(P)H-hydrate epimerase [Candidatus Micrarchaeota archaeon]
MERYVTAQQMREIDRIAQEEFGIPSFILMENAGRSCAEIVENTIKDRARMHNQNSSNRSKIVVVCGKGNNGGDGFVCARHLINRGFEVMIFVIGKSDELKGDAKVNYDILKKMDADIRALAYQSMEFFKQELGHAALVVDAIFGTGISREIREPYKTIIENINESQCIVVSLDVPSGLDATGGRMLGTCIMANKTVTLAFPKTGLAKGDGPHHAGEIIVADISIPKHIFMDRIKI